MEKQKQLEIDNYTVEELRIERNPRYTEAAKPPDVSVDFELFVNAHEATRFAVGLIIRTCGDESPVGENECPFRVTLRVVGFYSTIEPLPDGQVPAPLAVNGLTILYGIARGIIGTASSWFGTPLVVPTVYFSKLVQARIEKIQSAQRRVLEGAESIAE